MKQFGSLLVILFVSVLGFGQASKDLTAATGRAKRSSELITHFAELGPGSLPVENLRKAKAVAVFPDLDRVSILLSELTIGTGLASIRSGDEWGVPVFVKFKGSDFNMKIAGKKSFDLVLLIMDDDIVADLEKRGFGPGDKKHRVVLGPVIGGEGTEKQMENASVLYYAFDNGKLIDVDLKNNTVMGAFAVVHNNDLNKSIFGIKSKELFMAKANSVNVPTEIDAFRATLTAAIKPSVTGSNSVDKR